MFVPPFEPWFAIDGALFGLCVGSFANLAAYRLPVMASAGAPPYRSFNLSRPRSSCPRCTIQIKARDNIPVLSYLCLRGRCRQCGWSIPMRYPAVEAGMGLSWATAAYMAGLSLSLIPALGLATAATLIGRKAGIGWVDKKKPA